MAARDSLRAPGSRSESVAKKRAGNFTFGGVRESMLEKQRQAELAEVRRQAVETVRQAPGIQYEYRPEFQGAPGAGAGPQVGVRAQDLERTPLGAQSVNQGPTGMKEVDPGKLVMVHAAALHDMEERLRRLEGNKR